MATKVSLTLDGKPLEFGRKSQSAEALRAYLNKAPAHRLFSPTEISNLVNINQCTTGRVREQLDGYTLVFQGKRYWGSPKAIKRLERKVAAYKRSGKTGGRQ